MDPHTGWSPVAGSPADTLAVSSSPGKPSTTVTSLEMSERNMALVLTEANVIQDCSGIEGLATDVMSQVEGSIASTSESSTKILQAQRTLAQLRKARAAAKIEAAEEAVREQELCLEILMQESDRRSLRSRSSRHALEIAVPVPAPVPESKNLLGISEDTLDLTDAFGRLDRY